jgi:hypothetical protein
MSGKGWEVEKDVVYPGRVVVPGPRGPIVYDITRTDAARMAATGSAQLRAGWHTPVAWEHQDVEPSRGLLDRLRLSHGEKDYHFARGCFGHAAAYRVSPDGRVLVTLKGDDPDDYEQLKKVKFVSPEIQWDWMDSDGRVWPGPTITHVAATARPVQRHQQPVGVRLSLRAGNPTRIVSFEKFVKAVRVAPMLGSTTRPHGKLRLSLTDYEATPMADELNFGEAGDDATGGGKGSAWERIVAALEGRGIHLGGVDIKDADHLADLIEVACANGDDTADLDDEGDLGAEPEEEPGQPGGDLDMPPPGAAAAPPPPLQMSLRRQQAQAEGFARKNLIARIDELARTRRITPAIADELRGQVPALRMSFTAAGDPKPSTLTAQLDAYERLQPNASWTPDARRGGKKVRMSQRGNPVARPSYERTADDGDIDPAVLREQERLANTYSVGATK